MLAAMGHAMARAVRLLACLVAVCFMLCTLGISEVEVEGGIQDLRPAVALAVALLPSCGIALMKGRCAILHGLRVYNRSCGAYGTPLPNTARCIHGVRTSWLHSAPA